jgi:hypothetical protein
MAVTAVADPPKAPKYPEPLVSLREHPVRWARNHAQAVLISIPASHVVVLAWIALYFIAFELVHPVKAYWDALLSRHIRLLSQPHWNTWRHMFRSGGESYLATMTVLFLLFNPYKHPHALDKIHSAAGVIGRVLLTLLLMIPLFVALGLLMHQAQHWFHTGVLAPSIGAHPSLAAKLYSDSWTTKVVVVAAGILGRRPMFPVFAFVLEYFAERRVAHGGTDHWWEPAPYRAMVRQQTKEGVTSAQRRQTERNRSVTLLVIGGTLVTVLLACYGVYILNHYAK